MINLYPTTRTDKVFCPLWVLPVTDVFFGSNAYLGFLIQMRKWLFKWYDSPGFRHPPSLRQPPKE